MLEEALRICGDCGCGWSIDGVSHLESAPESRVRIAIEPCPNCRFHLEQRVNAAFKQPEQDLESLEVTEAVKHRVRAWLKIAKRRATYYHKLAMPPWIASSDDGRIGVNWKFGDRGVCFTFIDGDAPKYEWFAWSESIAPSSPHVIVRTEYKTGEGESCFFDVLSLTCWLLTGKEL